MLPMHELGVDTLMSISDEVFCDEVAEGMILLEFSKKVQVYGIPRIIYLSIVNTTLSSVDTAVSIPDTTDTVVSKTCSILQIL